MGEDVYDFLKKNEGDKHFNQVISLHDSPRIDWESAKNMAPFLPRGWYELSRLPVEDRIEFSHEFWQSKLTKFGREYGKVGRRLDDFFENLEEIGIYLTQSKPDSPFEVHMTYSLKEATGFFQGGPPASQEMRDMLNKRFGHIDLPCDYLSFLAIHDGFSKYTDTGLIKSRDLAQVYQKLQRLLADEILVSPDGQLIDPENLIPFYESFGLHCYQCFYTDWYPHEEMGNVYFSEHDRSLSNFQDRRSYEKNLAFPSFLGWLMFYLEDIWSM